MTTPVSLPQFTATEFAEAAVSHDSLIAGADSTVQPISALVRFTPSYDEVVVPGSSPPMTLRLRPILGRLDTDGHLKAINGDPVYYLDGSTRNPCPAGTSPVYGDQTLPMYWVEPDGTHVANPSGTPVYGIRLVQNSALLALPEDAPLTYLVSYSGVVYDGHDDLGIDSFRFAAPASDSVVDLGSVARLPVSA